MKHMFSLLIIHSGNALNLAFVSSDGKAINTKNLLFNAGKKKYYYKVEKTGLNNPLHLHTSVDAKRAIKKIYHFLRK